MNRSILVAALTLLAALTALSGCSQKATESSGTPDASASDLGKGRPTISRP